MKPNFAEVLQLILKDIPKDYLNFTSIAGESSLKTLIITPILHENTLLGVLELGSIFDTTHQHNEYLRLTLPIIAIRLQTAQNKYQLSQALNRSQNLSKELQQQKDELKNQTLTLESAKGELEAHAKEIAMASKYKSQFLANMSHELRTPLNSLLIMAKSLADNKSGHLSVEEVEDAKIIHSSGQDLLTLINDIMDLSKVEAGMLSIRKENFSLENMLQNIYKVFAATAKEKNIEFLIKSTVTLNSIKNDRKRIEQILKNFLSNAFKFTKEGSVTLRVFFTDDQLRQERMLTFAVSDTGIGIPEDKYKLIFEAFQQEDGSISRRYGGTGLGLTISKELAKLLGGKIQLDSILGEGSTFSLHLPCETSEKIKCDSNFEISESIAHTSQQIYTFSNTDSKPAHISNLHPTISKDHQLLKKINILLVDDDMRNIFALSRTLEDYGSIVTKASSGQKALDTLSNDNNIELILMDIMMPGMNGYETIKRIHESRNKHIPIIALTANAMSEDRNKCLQAGATDYLPKPVDLEILIATIKRILKNS